jgi:hypothetical protein
MKASEKGNEELVRFLVENKANIYITNKIGQTALDYASIVRIYFAHLLFRMYNVKSKSTE